MNKWKNPILYLAMRDEQIDNIYLYLAIKNELMNKLYSISGHEKWTNGQNIFISGHEKWTNYILYLAMRDKQSIFYLFIRDEQMDKAYFISGYERRTNKHIIFISAHDR